MNTLYYVNSQPFNTLQEAAEAAEKRAALNRVDVVIWKKVGVVRWKTEIELFEEGKNDH